jgi:predicted transcriptional regulator
MSQPNANKDASPSPSSPIITSPTTVASDVNMSIARIRAALEAHIWKGRGALQDRLTLRSVLSKAEKAGRIHDVNVSVREVSASTGCVLSTASASLRRLEKTGWITRGSNNYTGSVRVPSRGWNLVVPTATPSTRRPQPIHATSITPFVPSAVGRGAGYVYEMLSPEPLPAADLAKGLQRAKRTIYRHLARLETYGLAERTSEGWVRSDEDPAMVAKTLGVDKQLQLRGDLYAQESLIFQRGRPPKRVTRSNGARVFVDVETGEIIHR